MRMTLPLLAIACGAPELASTMRMSGEAVGTDPSGITADCALDLIFEVTDEVVEGAWRGTHGGDVYRALTDAEGAGFGFQAFAFGDVGYNVVRPDVLRIHIPLNNFGDNPFWSALSEWEGTLEPDGTAHGEWTCAPLDIDSGGYLDTEITVEGTWELVPEVASGL